MFLLKVAQQLEDVSGKEWRIIGSHIGRETRDIQLCNRSSDSNHLFKLTAFSEAGETTVFYRVKLDGSFLGQ